MSQGQDAVQPDEFILRRIHKNHVNPALPPAVHFLGFRPSKDDTAGLSVYREKYTSAQQVAEAGRKPGEYYVVRLAVRDLAALNLSIVPDDLAEGPAGHALLPELNVTACEHDKKRLREVQVRLAELASQAIVHHPAS